MKALIVDDSPTVVYALTEIAEQVGYRVMTAHDGLTALAALQTTMPDLILLDIGLPCISGVDLLSAIKSTRDYNAIPVVIVTGSPKEKDKSVSQGLGVVDFITKPFDKEEIFSILNNLSEM